MKKLDPTMAQQVAKAIRVFGERRIGFPPKAVTVVLAGRISAKAGNKNGNGSIDWSPNRESLPC